MNIREKLIFKKLFAIVVIAIIVFDSNFDSLSEIEKSSSIFLGVTLFLFRFNKRKYEKNNV